MVVYRKMMRIGLKSLFLWAVLSVLAGCTGHRDGVTFRIVATSDVHGLVFDTDCVTGTERSGSLAKFSSFLKKQRKEYSNVIYLDAGDMLQGSVEMYQDLTAQFVRHSLAAEALNLLGCDAMVMGNHDFAVGANSYDRFFKGLKFPLLGANVFFEQYGDYMTPYRIIDVRGLKVAVIGFTTPIINYTIPRDMMELELAPVVEAARHWMPVLKEKADVVVGLIHSGLDGGRSDNGDIYENNVRRLVAEVPGFNLIIYGHDHVARCINTADCNGDSVLLLNPGPFAMNAAVATVNVRSDESGNPVILTSGSIEDITDEVADNRYMKKLSGWYDDVCNYSDSVIGSVSDAFDCSGILWRGSSMMDYVHGFQMKHNGAQVSLTSPAFRKQSIPSGDLQIRDLFDLYRFDNTMVSVMMKGSEVKDILEYSAGLFYNTVADGNGPLLRYVVGEDGVKTPEQSVNRLITAAGIDYVIDVTKPAGERVTILSFTDGSVFDPDAYYRTTVNSFLFGGTDALQKAAGLTIMDMQKRLVSSSMADIRYYMLTNLALSREAGRPVTVRPLSSGRLIPEDIVSDCLKRDTIHFSVLKTETLW